LTKSTKKFLERDIAGGEFTLRESALKANLRSREMTPKPVFLQDFCYGIYP
jgi:hypothetical protein